MAASVRLTSVKSSVSPSGSSCGPYAKSSVLFKSTRSSGLPPSGETRMIAVPAVENRMPLLSQEMPNGPGPTWQIGVAVPPEMAMRLSHDSAQKTSDWPSGENTGLIAGAVPGIAVSSKSDSSRR